MRILNIDRSAIEENNLRNFQKEFDELYKKYFQNKQ